MIAKTIPRIKSRKASKPASSRFAASVEYAAGEAGAGLTEGLTAHFTKRHELAAVDAINYAINEKQGWTLSGERVVGVFGHGVASLATAAREMEAVARQKDIADPVTHIVVSYDTERSEAPTAQQIVEDFKRLLRARGYTDSLKHLPGKSVVESAEIRTKREAQKQEGELNQFVLIIHGDTKNLHGHGIANRVARNGVVCDDYRSKMKNEAVCAAIAIERGWEVVAGKHNSAALLRQAEARGATAEELEALSVRKAATLNRLREAALEPAFDRDAEKAKRQARNAEFSALFADRIQSVYATATTYADFVACCNIEGVKVKLRVEEGTQGRKFFKVSYATIDDGAGQSGSKIGVSAKALRAKFPDIDGAGVVAPPAKTTAAWSEPNGAAQRPAQQKAPIFLNLDEFVEKHGGSIRAVFHRSDSQQAFVATCRDIGIDAKLRAEIGRDGKTYHKLAFSTREGAMEVGGASGAAVGIPAKSLLGRFGGAAPISPMMPAATGLEAGGDGDLERYRGVVLAQAVAARHAIAERDRSKIGAVIDFVGGVGEALGSRSLRQIRRNRQERHDRQNTAADKLARRGTGLTNVLDRVQSDKKRIADQLWKAQAWQQERLLDQLAALSIKGKYEMERDAFVVREAERRRQETDKAWQDATGRRDGRIFLTDVGQSISKAFVSDKGRQKFEELRRINAEAAAKRKVARENAKHEFAQAKAKIAASKLAPPTFAMWLAGQKVTAEVRAAQRHNERVQKWLDGQRKAGQKDNAPAAQQEQTVGPRRFFDDQKTKSFKVKSRLSAEAETEAAEATSSAPESLAPASAARKQPTVEEAQQFLRAHKTPAKDTPEHAEWLEAARVIGEAKTPKEQFTPVGSRERTKGRGIFD